ncbi:MAG TPA: NYN domain-containing protein [Mycobacteriales bacterium]|nr:NYN domain-containing protein [Mycobacteriales bacterium]
MLCRTRIFIDYWNYQLSWNDRMGRDATGSRVGCDWTALPAALAGAAGRVLAGVGLTGVPQVEETLLYASVDPATETRLRGWLTSTVDRMPSYRVTIRERRPQRRPVHCRSCGADTERCPACGDVLRARVEKGVDAQLVTDMLTLAWHDAYDLAILVTSDADFVPAVQRIQERGLKVVNAAWRSKGHDLKAACWASFDLDEIAKTICR